MAFSAPRQFPSSDQTSPKVENHLSVEAKLVGHEWRDAKNEQRLTDVGLWLLLEELSFLTCRSDGDISFRASENICFGNTSCPSVCSWTASQWTQGPSALAILLDCSHGLNQQSSFSLYWSSDQPCRPRCEWAEQHSQIFSLFPRERRTAVNLPLVNTKCELCQGDGMNHCAFCHGLYQTYSFDPEDG